MISSYCNKIKDSDNFIEDDGPIFKLEDSSAIPLGCYMFELPPCARCTLGYFCKTHNSKGQEIEQ